MGLVRGSVRSDTHTALGRLIETAHDPQNRSAQNPLLRASYCCQEEHNGTASDRQRGGGRKAPENDHRVCLPAIHRPDDPRVAGTASHRQVRAPLPRATHSSGRTPVTRLPATKRQKCQLWCGGTLSRSQSSRSSAAPSASRSLSSVDSVGNSLPKILLTAPRSRRRSAVITTPKL